MDRLRPEAVWRFALRALAWLIPSFTLWYYIAAAHGRPVSWIAQQMVNAYANPVVTALEWHGAMLTMVTKVAVRTAEGQRGVLTPEINPLTYTYGSALFLALALAGRLGPGRVALGLAALLPFHAWGVAFEMLVELGVRAGPDVAVRAGIVGLKREFAVLGYQLGSLIFPTLVPVVLWAALGGLGGSLLKGPASAR